MVVRPRRSLSDHDEKRCGDDGHFCSPPPSLQSLTPPLSPPPPALFLASQPSAFDMEDGSPPPPSSLLTPIQISSKNHLLTLALVIVSAAVLAVCLLSLAYYITQRYSSNRRRRADAVASTPAQPPFDDPAGELLREELVLAGGTEEPYHVWYIRTAGLDEAVIGRIAVWKYKKGEEIVDSADCAVCLGEFAEGESLRLLPKCSHAFHVSCIDTWLRSHINCPLCRAPILAPLPSPAAPGVTGLGAATVPVPGGSIVGDGDAGSDGNENILVSTPEHMADSGFNSVRPPAEDSFSSDESEIWMSIDLEGNDANRSAAPPDDWAVGVDLQPVRRSISMDSSALVGVLLRTRMEGSSRDVWRKSNLGDDKKDGTGENKGKGASPAKEMERSMSGGRFFLSRFSGRGNRRAVLPL